MVLRADTVLSIQINTSTKKSGFDSDMHQRNLEGI